MPHSKVNPMRYIPNALTILRIFIAFGVMGILLYGDMHSQFVRFLACGLFLVGAISDFLDGFLARAYGAQSRFGEVFDPLADKLLVFGAFIALLVLDLVSPWAVFLILSREFLVMGLRVVVAMKQSKVSADFFGKTKSVSQYLAIACLILQILPTFWNQILLWFAVVLTLISGINYVKNYLKSL